MTSLTGLAEIRGRETQVLLDDVETGRPRPRMNGSALNVLDDEAVDG